MNKTEIEVFVGVDMAKEEHYSQAITPEGVELFSRPVGNDQAVIEAMLNDAKNRLEGTNAATSNLGGKPHGKTSDPVGRSRVGDLNRYAYPDECHIRGRSRIHAVGRR